MERQRNIVTAGPGGTDTATQAEGAVCVDIEEHDSALIPLREVRWPVWSYSVLRRIWPVRSRVVCLCVAIIGKI